MAVELGVLGEVFDDGEEVDGVGGEVAVFGDFDAVEDFESVAGEHAFASAFFKNNDLAVDIFFAGGDEDSKKVVDEGADVFDFAGFGEEVDVEVRHVLRCVWDLLAALGEDPSDEFF